MNLSEFPNDILFLFLKAAAESSINDLTTLARVNKAFQTVYQFSRHSLRFTWLRSQAGQFADLAFQLAEQDDLVVDGQPLRSETRYRVAGKRHSRIQRFAQSLADYHERRRTTDIDPEIPRDEWIRALYIYAIYGLNDSDKLNTMNPNILAFLNNILDRLFSEDSYFAERMQDSLEHNWLMAIDFDDIEGQFRRFSAILRQRLTLPGNWKHVGVALGVWEDDGVIYDWDDSGSVTIGGGLDMPMILTDPYLLGVCKVVPSPRERGLLIWAGGFGAWIESIADEIDLQIAKEQDGEEEEATKAASHV